MSTRTDTLFPYTTLFRSGVAFRMAGIGRDEETLAPEDPRFLHTAQPLQHPLLHFAVVQLPLTAEAGGNPADQRVGDQPRQGEQSHGRHGHEDRKSTRLNYSH